MLCDERCDHRIHQPLKGFVAIPIQDRRVGHQVPHVAHQKEGAPFERERRFAIGCQVLPVGVQPPRHLGTGFDEGLFQIPAHQAQPVAVGQHLVLSVHASHRVFAVHDRGHRAFKLHICQPRLIPAADGVGPIKDQLYMQAVVAQQDGIRCLGMPAEPNKLLWLHQRLIVYTQPTVADRIAPRIGVADTINGESFVQKYPRPCHNPRAMPLIIATGRRHHAHGICAIKPVIEAAPPRVCRVQRKPCVGDRHHQLRPGNTGNLRVHIGCLD